MQKKIIILGVSTFLVVGCFYIFLNSNEGGELVQVEEHLENLTYNKEIVEGEGFIYESDADNELQCSSYEKFDSKRKVCYYECNAEADCKAIADLVNQELSSWTDELEKDKEPVAEKNIPENDKSLKAEYSISVGEKINFKSGKDTDEYRKIWQDISDLSPNSLSDKYIEEFQVFDNATDDTLAFVDDEDGNGKWRVAVNLSGHKSSSEKEQKATFIHELGHIISLNLSQVDNQTEKKDCRNFYLDEGCTKINSYVNLFKNSFWKNVSQQNFDENKFVTEYATTNEVEDLAESFAFFVLEKDKSSLGNLVKEEKIKSFYNYPELVTIRNDMRSVLSKDIIRARKK